MGLFDRFKKGECLVCGKEIGALGKRKIDDGYICKECAGKLSPFYTGRKRSTLDDIRAQLEYREANKADVEAFQAARTLGLDEKVMIDDMHGTFVVVRGGRGWRDANPDVIPLSQVTGAQVDFDETRQEETYTDKEGNRKSYIPPRFTYSYSSEVVVNVNNPWFDGFTIDVSSGTSPMPHSLESEQSRAAAQEICDALTTERERIHEAVEADRTPKSAVVCPHCKATTMPDANGRCEYCGGALDL
ncbi:DUF4428 domain-containing protein [Curtanaerobium respiraculi]|uniref:DUF4428 domain-containing protein n=1 Tax=Curtanaerobium respiraculi TaxID=2949669 RepID=UPI0024B3B2C2|nr:DUF4428 domain-containing protein [Curtanaerobium respiraculi]